jgi:hypothetical protein
MDYELIDNKVVETLAQPPIVVELTKEEVETKLAEALSRQAIKQAELDGVTAEVTKFQTYLALFN